MPSEGEILWHIDSKPASDLDLVGKSGSRESRDLRNWSYLNGFGNQEFKSRYIVPEPFFFSTMPNYKQIWMVFCELLFALRRPHSPDRGHGHGAVSDFWWSNHRGDEEVYTTYPEDEIKYGWVLYLDIEEASGVTEVVSGVIGTLDGRPVNRRDMTMVFRGEGPEEGGSEDQAVFSPGEAEAARSSTPIDVPEFPKWGDKIKEKFHRSVDKDMSEWDNSLDDWKTELQIALTN